MQRASFAIVCVLTLAAATAAQAVDPETTAAARRLAVEGVKLARAGDCQRALDPLMRAEELRHSSIVSAELGACYVQLGRLVAGSEALRQVVREGLPDEPTPAQREALTRAQQLLDLVLPKIAQLSVIVSGTRAEEVELKVDEQTVPVTLLGVPRPTDPGRHRVTASASGFHPAQVEVQLSEGESRRVELALDPDQAQATLPAPHFDEPDAQSARERPALQTSPPGERSGLRAVAYVFWGVGAAFLATGGVFGSLARSDKQHLDHRCDGNLCPEALRDDIVEAKRWGLLSTIGFAAGAACAVAGSIAYPLARRRERRPATVLSGSLTLGGGAARLQF